MTTGSSPRCVLVLLLALVCWPYHGGAFQGHADGHRLRLRHSSTSASLFTKNIINTNTIASTSRRRHKALDMSSPQQEEVPGSVEGIGSKQQLALGLGSVALLIILANRLLLPAELLYDSQSRTDLLGVVAIGGLVLNALGDLEVKTRTATSVRLDGVKGRGISTFLSDGMTYSVLTGHVVICRFFPC